MDLHFRGAKPDQVVAILKAREPARMLIAKGNGAMTAGTSKTIPSSDLQEAARKLAGTVSGGTTKNNQGAAFATP